MKINKILTVEKATQNMRILVKLSQFEGKNIRNLSGSNVRLDFEIGSKVKC